MTANENPGLDARFLSTNAKFLVFIRMTVYNTIFGSRFSELRHTDRLF